MNSDLEYLNYLSDETPPAPGMIRTMGKWFIDHSYQCCGSGMFIPDPRFLILIFTHPGSRISDPRSRIPDPKTATKERGEKKLPFYVATNFTNLNIILV
jgi:hypothetical protein